jgi:enolase-phosphatase E1
VIRAILTDIEGTTSSISFVKDVLFPYARERIGDFVRCHAEDPHIVPHLNDVRLASDPSLDLEGVVAQLENWIDTDQKITPLKALQGLIWEEGYRNGDFHGHVYPDAVEQLRRWHDDGIRLYVYSSGSVYAQRLLFGHTEFGDLTPLFSGYFDTTIGAKGDSTSYRRIRNEIGLPAAEILFLSDIPAELDAAGTAGMQTTQLLRDDDVLPSSHQPAADFSRISLT